MESRRNIARTWEFLMQDEDPNLWIFKQWYAFWMSEEACWSDVSRRSDTKKWQRRAHL